MNPRIRALTKLPFWACLFGIPGGVLSYYKSEGKDGGDPPFGLGVIAYTVLFVLFFMTFLVGLVRIAMLIVRKGRHKSDSDFN